MRSVTKQNASNGSTQHNCQIRFNFFIREKTWGRNFKINRWRIIVYHKSWKLQYLNGYCQQKKIHFSEPAIADLVRMKHRYNAFKTNMRVAEKWYHHYNVWRSQNPSLKLWITALINDSQNYNCVKFSCKSETKKKTRNRFWV